MQRHVAICTPARDGQVAEDFCASLAQSMPALAREGIGASWQRVSGSANVPRARNICVANAFAAGADDVFFIDSDMGWNADDLIRVIRHEADIVGGVYQRRTSNNVAFTINPLHDDGSTDHTGLIPCDFVATGFLRVRGHVFDAIEAPPFDYASIADAAKPYLRAWFEYRVRDREFEGEDVTFSRKCREAGFTVYADPHTRLRHHSEFCFNHCLADFMAAGGAPQPEAA